MTTEEARQYFKDRQLDYLKIDRTALEKLMDMVDDELLNYLAEGSEHAVEMGLKLSKPLKKDSSFKYGGIEYAYIKVDGSYFKKREAISFNKDKFIGFCGELSSVNSEPIIRGFCNWCDWLFEYVKAEKLPF